jgi:hypothetical protein
MNTTSPGQVRTPRFRRRGVCLALAMAAALLVGVPAQAAENAPSTAACKVTINATHWSIRGSGSGTRYQIVARGVPCSVAVTWVRKLSQRTNTGLGSTFRAGPSGYLCRSVSVPASGDKLLYAGACVHAPGVPFFGWSAKP